MSLGLNDLQKKRPQKKEQKKDTTKQQESQQPTREQYPAGAWARSQTTKPWSGSTLSKSSSNRKRKNETVDAYMNEEWASQHAAPLFWIDLHQQSWLASLHRRLSSIEARVHSGVTRPLRYLRRFIGR